MATINDLTNKSILDMTEEELYSHIMSIRSSRRVPKKEVKETSKKSSAPKSTMDLVKMLTPEMQEELLKRLEGG